MVSGRTRYYVLFKKHMAKAGAWLMRLAEICRAERKKIVITLNLGYRSIRKYYTQFDHIRGEKRLRKDSPYYESKHGGLSEAQVKRNRKISRIRMPVEWAMGDMKRYRLLRGPYMGAARDLDRDMSIIASLSNINEFWVHKNDRLGPLPARLASKMSLF